MGTDLVGTNLMEGANLVEVFSSIQGEGILVGVRQLFVRFAGCNLNCRYCDTSGAHGFTDTAAIEYPPASGRMTRRVNPVSPDTFIEIIRQFDPVSHHSLSLTGGEPLLAADFLATVLPELHFPGKIYLETNGTLPESLNRIIDYVDLIAMDIKLPSATGKVCWEQHREFLRLGKRKGLFVKIVVTPDMLESELKEAVNFLAAVDRGIPLVLQPATPVGEKEEPVSASALIRLADLASMTLADVRVIPQTHIQLRLK